MEKEYDFYAGKKILMDDRFFKLTTDTVLLSAFAAVKAGERGLDIGAGVGCLGLLVSLRHGAVVDGVEISGGAAALARRNYEKCGGRGEIFEGDCAGFRCREKYDFCLSNPPYFGVADGLLNKEDGICTARHAGLCDFFAAAARTMKYPGRFFFCLRASELGRAFADLHACGLSAKRLRFVHDTAGAAAKTVLVEASLGNTGLITEKPLFLKDENGHTKEYCEIYGI